jgi:hypothetical protein
MGAHGVIVEYDTGRYPFARVLAAEVFRGARLDQLHVSWRRRLGHELTYADNLSLRRRMQRLPDDATFYKLYHAWIAGVVAPRYGGKISYSAHPKMRVHLAGTGSVSEFHTDVAVTGRSDQVNCYLPFTDVHDTCTVWSETGYGTGDYAPLNLSYGQALLWDGGRLRHGTYHNLTDSTRVSCDFRFRPLFPARVRSPWRDVLAGRPPALCAESSPASESTSESESESEEGTTN